MTRTAALFALLVAVGVAGCGGTEPGAGSPDAIQTGMEPSDRSPARTLVVDETPRPAVEAVRILLVGYTEDQLEEGRPAQGVVPPFFWVSPELAPEWPLRFGAPIPAGLHVTVVRDMDDDGRPSPADRRSAFLVVPVKNEGELQFRIDRGFLDGADPGAGARPPSPSPEPPPSGDDGPRPDGVVLQPAGADLIERTVRGTSGTPDVPPPAGNLLVVGFSPGQLEDGLPVPGTKPAFLWTGAHGEAGWPLEVAGVPLPAALELIFAIDADGDGMPSPPDLAATPRVVGDADPVEVIFDRPFAPAETADGDDDGGEEDGFGGDEDDAPLPDTEESAARGALRPINLDSEPRVPFLRNGVLMVVGYDPDDVEATMPREEGVPKFFWASEDLQLTWPLQLEVPLPEGGLTVFFVLDLDGDRRPSPGDLASKPYEGFEPGEPGVDLEVRLNTAFGLVPPTR